MVILLIVCCSWRLFSFQVSNLVLVRIVVHSVNVILFLYRSSGEESKTRSFLPADKQFLITRNGKWNSNCNYQTLSLIVIVVPAIPPETLSQLQESCDKNDALDYFQSVNVEIPQIIHEISQNTNEVTEDSDDFCADDLDDIPDMEDFDNQNLLVTNDPVNRNSSKWVLIILFFRFHIIMAIMIKRWVSSIRRHTIFTLHTTSSIKLRECGYLATIS